MAAAPIPLATAIKDRSYISNVRNGEESWLWNIAARQVRRVRNPDTSAVTLRHQLMSATIQTKDEEIIKKIIGVCKRDPRVVRSQPAVANCQG